MDLKMLQVLLQSRYAESSSASQFVEAHEISILEHSRQCSLPQMLTEAVGMQVPLVPYSFYPSKHSPSVSTVLRATMQTNARERGTHSYPDKTA